jgi:nickel-type superoxide dismutase maturation protease
MPRKGGGRNWAVPFLLLAGGAGIVAVARRYTRYEVAGGSMRPTLEPGDFLVVDRRAYERRPPEAGDVVLLQDPREPARAMVKRVERVNLAGDLVVAGDNPAASTDSRAFGPVPAGAVLGRVAWRYWPPSRAGRVR